MTKNCYNYTLQGCEATIQDQSLMAGMGSFCMTFSNVNDAIGWCVEVQNELLKLPLPDSLQHCADAEGKLLIKVNENRSDILKEWDDEQRRQVETAQQKYNERRGSQVLLDGLRVRMGVHTQKSRTLVNPITNRNTYREADVEMIAFITAQAHGGQVTHASFNNV